MKLAEVATIDKRALFEEASDESGIAADDLMDIAEMTDDTFSAPQTAEDLIKSLGALCR